MPEQSRRIRAAYTIRISKSVRAPPRYAYDWCTDFRADDGKFSGSRPRYRVLQIGNDRVVRIRTTNPRSGVGGIALELVRLSPPNRWHVDQIDENDLAAVDYSVRRLGPRRCRVTLDITERWMTPGYPKAGAYRKSTSEYWDTLVSALEADYRSGRPARRRS